MDMDMGSTCYIRTEAIGAMGACVCRGLMFAAVVSIGDAASGEACVVAGARLMQHDCATHHRLQVHRDVRQTGSACRVDTLPKIGRERIAALTAATTTFISTRPARSVADTPAKSELKAPPKTKQLLDRNWLATVKASGEIYLRNFSSTTKGSMVAGESQDVTRHR
jgi:hypothetical protein